MALDENNEILKALQSVKNESGNLYNCLFQLTETRKALEANLNTVENKVSEVDQEMEQLESINAINFYKIQNLEKEAKKLEEKQKFYNDTINKMERKIKDFKENSEIKVDDFVREAEKLCELYLSAVNKENVESECAKIFDEIHVLKSEIEEKEGTLFRLKKELEEFVFDGTPENSIEASVSLDERQYVMNILQEQLLNARKQHQNLKQRKEELDAETRELMKTEHVV